MMSSITSGSITGTPDPNASPVTERRPSIVCSQIQAPAEPDRDGEREGEIRRAQYDGSVAIPGERKELR